LENDENKKNHKIIDKYKNDCKYDISVKNIYNDNSEEEEIKYTSIEEENLINTSCCFISNTLLDRLMDLKDPNLFLNIIEKIIVNNIVYSILGKDKYTSSNKLDFNNNVKESIIKDNKENEKNRNLSKIEKEYNYKKNAFIRKLYSINSKEIINIKVSDKKPIMNNRRIDNFNIKNERNNSDMAFEEETFYNIYNKIKDIHNINKNKIDYLNENNNYDLNLSLDEKDKIQIEKYFNIHNTKNTDLDLNRGNLIQTSLTEDYFNNNGMFFCGTSEKNINEVLRKNQTSFKLENDKKEEKFNKDNIYNNNIKTNILKLINNVNFNDEQIIASGHIRFKNDLLGINNFNFNFYPK